jgi:hypothetical protein
MWLDSGHTNEMGKRVVIAVGLAAAAALTTFLLWQRSRERAAVHESHTVAEAVRRVTMLATVEMSLSNWQLRSDEKDLFGFIPVTCRKTVAVFYRGKVSAGFDLTPADAAAVAVNVSAGKKQLEVRLPAPRLLYTDVPAPELVVADGSLCNKVTPDDYSRLYSDARQAIQRQALAEGILSKAEANARSLIGEVVRPLGYQVDVRIGSPLSVSTAENRR